MNLRQKCKKLKQENARLKKWMSTTPITIPMYREDCYKRQTVGVTKTLHEYEEFMNREAIKRNMALELAATLYPYMKFDEYTDNHSGRLVIQARLDVIVPDEREV